MRQCKKCHAKIVSGFTNGFGDFYVCDNCFQDFMDERYGKRMWMAVDDDGSGGYYLASATHHGSVGKPYGTGIYWTEWEEDDDE